MKNAAAMTPFDQGKNAAKLAPVSNPHPDGSVENRNYELGRQFGLRTLRNGDIYRTRGSLG